MVGAAKRGQAGYSLAVLIMMATVMSILVAAALPAWSKMIQHDKEEELIARGWQYVEAIRVFQHRFGRYPTTLDELIKAKPRSIRHLYKDPITGEDFAPIFLNQPLTAKPPRTPPASTRKGAGGASEDDDSTRFDPGKPKVVPTGPIIGVHSTSSKESSLLFYGRDHYDQWTFTVQLLTHRLTAPGGGAAAGGGRTEVSVRWLGRPPFNNMMPAGMPVQPQTGVGRNGQPTRLPGGKPLP
jgi:type II secretory pathway pseudopilin PulG